MIPNDEQVLAIRQYLTKHLSYRETKYEMFDHILTSLEHQPNDIPFGDAMNKVIENIGGIKGLKSIEFAARVAALGALVKSYWGMLWQVCRSPLIALPVGITLAMFYAVEGVWFNYFIYPLLIIINVPVLVVKRGVMTSRNSVFVKNGAFTVLFTCVSVLMPGLMFLATWLVSAFFFDSYRTILTYIYTMIFFLALLNALVLYKLTRKEFKVIIADI